MPKLPEVLIVTPETSLDQLMACVTGGPLPDGSIGMSFDEYQKIGRIDDCDCKLIQCVCLEARQHKIDCPYRKALTCAIPFECEKHGLDVCVECDRCTCND